MQLHYKHLYSKDIIQYINGKSSRYHCVDLHFFNDDQGFHNTETFMYYTFKRSSNQSLTKMICIQKFPRQNKIELLKERLLLQGTVTKENRQKDCKI